MGQGYTRNDSSNNIANGKVIDAADLDGEFDAIVEAFDAATGHNHDGTAAGGGAISKLGPNQEYEGTGSDFHPKTDDTYGLGTSLERWSELHVAGDANVGDITSTSATFTGDVTIQSGGGQTTPRLKFDGTSHGLYSNSSGIFAAVNGVQSAVIEGVGTSISDDQAVVTKEKGDARYARLSNDNTYTQEAKYTTNGLGLLQFQRGGTGRIWGIGTDTNQNSMTFYDFDNSQVAARVEEGGTSASQSTTLMTREKGDARYARLSGDTFTGQISMPSVRLTGTSDVTLTGTGHPLQTGPTSGSNLAFDGNEIQARNNGAASQLNLNIDGGTVKIGNSSSSVNIDGTATVGNGLFVGENGGGDSAIQFYDDNSNTWRTFQWDDNANDWFVEAGDGTFGQMWHAGNVERGSNSNGEYVRFPDGTQVCTHSITSSASSATTWTYPASFNAVPSISFQAVSSLVRFATSIARYSTSAGFKVYDNSGVQKSNATECIAIGTWK